MILIYIAVSDDFGVVHCESEVRIVKFNMADPRCRLHSPLSQFKLFIPTTSKVSGGGGGGGIWGRWSLIINPKLELRKSLWRLRTFLPHSRSLKTHSNN